MSMLTNLSKHSNQFVLP